ncbi:MAG: efflux RND transporter periplasmic adaptor subunit [Elusimicrobiota bacterium]
MRNKIFFWTLTFCLLFSGCGLNNKNDRLVLHGRIELDEVHLGSKISGRVVSLAVSEGEEVKKDQLLGYLDLYDKRKKDLERAESLFHSGALPKEQLEDARIAFQDQCLISPIDGVVLLKGKFQGETVSSGQTIISIGSLKDVYAKVYIPEKDLGKIKLNQPAQIKVDSFPDKVYPGKIIYIASFSEFTPKNVQTEEERTRRIYSIKIKPANENEELKPGMPCDAEITGIGN